MKKIKNILFFSEAVTLAHIGRCVAVANKLHCTNDFNITLASDSRYDEIVGSVPYKRLPLYSISSKFFAKKLARGMPIYDAQTLINYVNDDLKIIDTVKPDFIVGDFRLSLAFSARERSIPYATITNAYWSPYACLHYPIPELTITKIFGVSTAQKMFDLARPFIFKMHALPFFQAHKKFNKSSFDFDLREIYTQADYTLYADIGSLIPMKPYPANHSFIGPIIWSVSSPKPSWWGNLPEQDPVIFVTLGSSGDISLLPLLLQTLSKIPVTVICATVDASRMNESYPNIYLGKFLPADAAVKKADLVICNGGSPMVYQSLVEGKPVIGFPSNLDQFLMMSQVEKAGYGIMIRPSQANEDNISAAVNQALSGGLKKSPYVGCSVDVDKIIEIIESATGA